MINISPSVAGIILMIAAVLGYVFGLIGARLAAAADKKEQDQLPPKADNPDGQETGIPKPKEPAPILRVRAGDNGKWALDLDGFPTQPETITPDQRQRLINIIVQIRPWIDGKTAAVSPQPPAAAPAPQVVPQQSTAVPTPPPTNGKPARATTPTPTGPPRINPLVGFRSLLASELGGKQEEKPPSIVSMIDSVLQTKLAGTPLEDKLIKLEEGPQGEVIVVVGSQRYDGIESVTDPEIKAVIKSAIDEWQSQ